MTRISICAPSAGPDLLTCGVRMYTKFHVARPRRKKPRRGWTGVLVIMALLGGVAWLAFERGRLSWFDNSRLPLSPTNAPAARAPSDNTNPPTLINTQIIVRAAPAKTTSTDTGAALKSVALLDAQIALDRLGMSSGSIDGVPGSQTRAALRAFQAREGLPQTGSLDPNTRAKLALTAPAQVSYRIEAADLSRLLPLAATWLGKSEQPRLDYESLLELVAEKSHAHPSLIRRLNAAVDWNAVPPGTEIIVPSVERERPASKAAFIQIRLSDGTLEAFDASNRLLAHFPCSIARHAEKRPVGELRVATVAPNPNYTFDPDVFPESPEARELARKLVLPPGPNNPVGAVWIGLDRPGYGIHGTPNPEEVGRTESHGCFRLANWNAEYLLQLVTVGTAVKVEP